MSAITTNNTNSGEIEEEQERWESYDEPSEQDFNPYVCELYAVADQIGEIETYIPDMSECIGPQPVHYDCQQAATVLGKQDSTIIYYTDGVLVRISPIDGTSQRFVPAISRPPILRLWHSSLLVGQPGERFMYDTMRQDFY